MDCKIGKKSEGDPNNVTIEASKSADASFYAVVPHKSRDRHTRSHPPFHQPRADMACVRRTTQCVGTCGGGAACAPAKWRMVKPSACERGMVLKAEWA
eukprot:2570115-Pleurochrysis_carterae.AAC.1